MNKKFEKIILGDLKLYYWETFYGSVEQRTNLLIINHIII